MILNAEEKIIELEYSLFTEIRSKAKKQVHKLMNLAQNISEIDALVSLSIASEELRLSRPILNDNNVVDIKNGRHPVVEHVSDKEYVPNDIKMPNEIDTLLITGPNMSGKSTYMREMAIIVILAQMGSFVPADRADIPIFDKIFTRIGASDDLVSGESTFMVEMKEANNAISGATKDSLILFDELGRGTATYDGMSLAASILEYINKKIKCKTMFSTHYHELTILENEISTIKNVHVSAKEQDGNVYFLHKIENGPVDKSYGIHVAKLAGLPSSLIERANEILEDYEKKDQSIKNDTSQISFDFEEKPKPTTDISNKLKDYIESLDPNSISPKEALDIVYIIKELSNENE